MSKRDAAYPRGLLAYAIFAGAVTYLANGHLSLGRGVAVGLMATAFWLAAGLAAYRRRYEPMRPSKPEPWDPLA